MKRKVMEYMVVFEKEPEGGYSVWVPELPGCASQGETFEEAQMMIKEAIELYLEDMNDEDKQLYKSNQDRFIVPVLVDMHV